MLRPRPLLGTTKGAARSIANLEVDAAGWSTVNTTARTADSRLRPIVASLPTIAPLALRRSVGSPRIAYTILGGETEAAAQATSPLRTATAPAIEAVNTTNSPHPIERLAPPGINSTLFPRPHDLRPSAGYSAGYSA